MPSGLSRQHLMPACLTWSLFIVSMALSLLRVVGFGATRPRACVWASNNRCEARALAAYNTMLRPT